MVPQFLWGSFQWFKKTGPSKIFMHNRRVSRLSVEKFQSHKAEKNRRGTLRCFKTSRVSEFFMQKGGGEYYDCPSVFLVSFPEKLRKGPFSV